MPTLFFLALLLITLPVQAQSPSLYQPQLALIAEGHTAQAYHNLRPKLLASAGNPDFDTAFGLAALDEGATTEAVAAFERVLAVQPANLPVRTELARAYAQLGDRAAAARELKLVQSQPQTPPEVRTNLSNYTSVLDEALSGGPATLTGHVTAGTGYDSNINTATNSSYLTVPALAALGPARIESGAQSQSSGYAESSAALTYRKPLSLSRAVFAGANVSHKQAFQSSNYTQTTLAAEAGLQFLTPDNGRITTSVGAQQFWFGNEDYSTTLSANASWQYPLSASTNLTTYATVSHIDYDQFAAQNANRAVIGSTVDTRLTSAWSPYLFLGLYGGTEQTEESATDYFSHNLLGLRAGFEVFPTTHLSWFTEASYEVRTYDADYPLFLKPRQDNQLDLTTGLSYALTSQLLLRPTLSYRNASSNIGFYNYNRWLASLGVRYSF